MYPDDVVSALHYDGLAADLVVNGWDVEALPCNRGCRDESRTYSRSELQEGVRYNRIWRPRFRQSSYFGRLINSVWMIVAWTKLVLRPKQLRPDIVIVGTDPMFAVMAAIPLKLIDPKIRVVHWCFDMHPEAAIASNKIANSNLIVRLVRKVMSAAYMRCNVIADIGPCMRTRLQSYRHHAREVELTPWALLEPKFRVKPNKKIRQELFGSAKLAVLYSGNFGEAHSFDEILAVVRYLRHATDIHFCFAVRGNKVDELKKAIGPEDSNVSFAGFAAIEELEMRLGAADIHIASLRPEWSGVAVPSKFFGSLAIGRPVLFAGPSESAIAQWIERFDIGWVLNLNNAHQIAQDLIHLSASANSIAELQERAHVAYKMQFSRSAVTDKWHSMLLDLCHK
jgi:glycosyltransferase involved in cell wall biosynthesis